MLLTITGLGLGAMYFLVASGLSLIYGLMGVLNFAHGAFITFGAYAAWWLSDQVGLGVEGAARLGAVFGIAVGRCSQRGSSSRSSARSTDGRSSRCWSPSVSPSSLGALIQGIWGHDVKVFPVPAWMVDTTTVLGRVGPERPVRRDRGRRVRADRVDRVPALHALRARDPRRCREPCDGLRARDRRAPRVHDRVRARRRARRARRRAVGHLLRRRSIPGAGRRS